MFGVSGLRVERLREAGASTLRFALAYAGWSVLWVAAHLAGGALVGAALGSAGALIPWSSTAAQGILALTLALGGLHHLGVWRFPMPQFHRQVPRHWMLTWPLTWTAVGYGIQLGAAVTTRITNFATYAALAAAFLSRSSADGALIMLVFGLARALPAAIVGPFLDSSSRSFSLAFRIGALEEHVHRASGIILIVAAALLFAATTHGL